MNRFPHTVSALITGAMLLGTYSLSIQADDGIEQDSAIEHDIELNDLTDRFSYAYGADLAEKFKLEGIVLNVDLLAQAMQAAFDGNQKRMSEGEIIATIDLYRGVQLKKKEAERAIASEKNKKEGEFFLAENAKRDDVLLTESGLQYRIISEGSGQYTPTLDDEVKVHYRGTFVDGTEFDSTYARNTPFKGTLRQLIDGWAEALQMMSQGAKWELYVPSHLAYGERGSDPYIGPNAVLIFEVELLEIEKATLSFAEP